jgi:glycosyltransferase involved in cell wall biosynthesis
MLPSVVKSCRSAAAIICGNGLDAGFLNQIRGQGKGLYVLSSAHFSVNEVKRFEKAGERKEPYAPLQAFAGGICIGSKGIRFALEALALARQKGTRVQFTVASFGPELNFLKHITRKLKLCDQVQFHDGFRGEAYDRALGKSHVFLLPSFREGSPRTILEAMLAGVVPVVCKASAQGEIVDPKVGFAIPISSRHELVRGLAEALILLDHDRELLQSMGRAARSKVSENYSEKTFLSKMESIYQETLQRKGSKQ